MSDQFSNISWDNSNIYSDLKDPKISQDFQSNSEQVDAFKLEAQAFEKLIEEKKFEDFSSIPLAQKLIEKHFDLLVKISSMHVFAQCELSRNSQNEEAKKIVNQVANLYAKLEKSFKPLKLFLNLVSEQYFEQFLTDPQMDQVAFLLRQERKTRANLLSVKEEILITGLALDGHHAWAKLYSEICGSMKIPVQNQSVGLAEAEGILRQGDRAKRETVYRGIYQSFTPHLPTFAAILNSLNGWRWETNRARSKQKELHYLDRSCHECRIERGTLKTLIDVNFEQKKIGHKALTTMAKIMGIPKLAPWDILAPMPQQKSAFALSFPQAVNIVTEAFGQLDPQMADFVQMMVKKKWIDGRSTENRGAGAHCTGFMNVREPRVFMTFKGSMSDVITLAHELGHAYHNWVMRDLPIGKTFYPMTLAETASTFGELLVREALLQLAMTKEGKMEILWQEAESVAGYCINIPSRFTFEQNLMEKRKNQELSVTELNTLMSQAWKDWYEDTLTEYNSLYWAIKMHFSFTKVSFYNYPYVFGYLFSLGIFAKKNSYKNHFHELYRNILRDTGAMTAEELIQKHLGEDIGQPHFWQSSFKILERSVDQFANLVT